MGAKSLGTTSSKAKPSSKSDLQESQPRRRPLQVQDSTDSESEIPPVRTVAQKTRNDPKSVAPLGLRRRNDVPEGETMSEKGEYAPPAKGSTKRKQPEETEDEIPQESSDDEGGPGPSRKIASRRKISSHSAAAETSGEDEEEQKWDAYNAARFSKRERRRKKAADVRASTWIKAKAKKKKEKSNLICLSERDERKQWPDAWKALADDCSQAVVRKIREVTGTGVGQKWSEVPNLDEEENEMLVIHFSAESGMKDKRNIAFAKKVVQLIREDEKQVQVITAPARHYISDKYLMQKTFKAMNGFKRAWKAQTDEDLAKTIAKRAKATRMEGRQMTAAHNLRKGAAIFLEEEFPEEAANTDELKDSRETLVRVGKEIISSEWMSETDSGPEDPVERKRWLEAIGKARDERGKPTACYNVKGKGRAIYEVIPVTWRSECYEWYLDQCRTAYESQHRVRTEERAYPRRYLAKLSQFVPPSSLIDLDHVDRLRENMISDSEKELCGQWGEDDDEDVAWFMKRMRKTKRRMEEEARELAGNSHGDNDAGGHDGVDGGDN